jgi:glycosyltransferase involved in cell wall biosynthesis
VTLLEWTSALQVRRIMQAVAPDVVIERFYTFGGAGLWAARSLGIPAVLEVNSPARPYPGSWRDRIDRLTVLRPVDRWRRTQLRWARAVYATSSRLLPPELKDRVRVVVNGVDTERFHPRSDPGEGRALRGVFVSSFHSWHAADDLVAATARCAAQGVDLQVVCIGTGPCWAAAQKAAARAGLGDRIVFLGEIAHADVPVRLQTADIGLAPFRPAAHRALELGWFWSPIKIFEYLASGLAVVTADIPELRSLLSDGVARFYQAGDPESLAAEIAALVADRRAVRRMGAAARELAVSRYSWAQQAKAVEEVVRSVV